MRIIVTGGAGFIGSHLTDALIEEGHTVLVLDNLSTGKYDNINSEAGFKHLDLSAIRGKERKNRELDRVFRKFKPEIVFHQAALPRVPRSVEDPIGTHRSNVTATVNVLKASVDYKVRRVLYAGSSSAYGDQHRLPNTEDQVPHPKNPYGWQKLMGEQYCRCFSEVFGLDTVILRYFNVYGERQPTEGAYKLVIAVFMEQKAKGEPFTIFCDGKQIRDFTHISDIVRGNLLAMESLQAFAGEVFNLCSGVETSVNEIADLIGGKDYPRIHLKPRPFEERRKLGSYAKAEKTFGYTPKVKIEQGIRNLDR